MSRWRLAVCCALAALALLARAQSYPYVIDSFHTDVVVNKDATIDVTETIKATFNERRHGIYRTIPIVYPTGRGSQRAIQLRLGSVVDESGNSHVVKTSREGGYLKVRIGQEDFEYPPGSTVTYVIQYHVFGAFNWFDKDDSWEPSTELYWNVTGPEWDTQITSSSFRVTFPEQGTDAKVRARSFAGAYGSRDSLVLTEFGTASTANEPFVDLMLTPSELTGTRTKPLSPYEALTFVLSLPQTAVPRPPPLTEFMRRATEYLPLLTPFVVMLVMFPIWWKHGRDRKDGPTQVRFEPPSSLPAAEAGTIMDERVDQRDLAAGIMSLCVKGYLTVELTQKEGFLQRREYTLHPTEKQDTTGLSLFEDQLLGHLLTCGKDITRQDLRNKVAPHVMEMKGTIYQDFVDRDLYRANPNSVRGMAIFGGVVLTAVVAFLLFKISLVADVWVVALGGLVGLIPAVSLGWQMPMRTTYGHQVRQETLGFFEMMRHRENYMKWVVDKQPDGLKYEEYLPYAVAFDCIDQWNDAFADIVHEPPSWYHDPYGGVFMASMFAHDIRSMASDFGSAASTPPRSDGASGGSSGFSSGGGFSGGGFGGGGGGSW